jgi:hypothetical protein
MTQSIVSDPAHGAARPSDYLLKALAYLRDHPDSSARTVADAIGCKHQDRFIFQLLDQAAYQGACGRSKTGNGPWLWEASEPPAVAECTPECAHPPGDTVGHPFPRRPGYVTGECLHAVAGSEWHAGFRKCERC